MPLNASDSVFPVENQQEGVDAVLFARELFSSESMQDYLSREGNEMPCTYDFFDTAFAAAHKATLLSDDEYAKYTKDREQKVAKDIVNDILKKSADSLKRTAK